jgi:hypothetical protein
VTPVTKLIYELTTPDFIPKTNPRKRTTTTPKPEMKINFTDPSIVDLVLREIFENCTRAMNTTLETFFLETSEKLDEEWGALFSELERDELFNAHESHCKNYQLMAFEEFQADLDRMTAAWGKHELSDINDIVMASQKQFLGAFKQNVTFYLVTQITSSLRFGRDKAKAINCSNIFVPEIVKLIENSFDGISKCYNVSMIYNETNLYQELITTMYKDTASYLTACSTPECFDIVSKIQKLIKWSFKITFSQYCPYMHLLVLEATPKATDAMYTIIKNLRAEVNDIDKCTKEYTANITLSVNSKDSLKERITNCFK